MDTTQSPYDSGSKASDFQPTTQNPQSLNSSNLQTPAANVQPVQSSSGTTGQQLYQQADNQTGLTVQTDSYSANSLVSMGPTPPRSNNGLLTVTSALVVLLLLTVIFGRYWRQLPAPLEGAEPEVSPSEDTAAGVDGVAALPVMTDRQSSRKPVAKKNKSAAKKKKRSKRK